MIGRNVMLVGDGRPACSNCIGNPNNLESLEDDNQYTATCVGCETSLSYCTLCAAWYPEDEVKDKRCIICTHEEGL